MEHSSGNWDRRKYNLGNKVKGTGIEGNITWKQSGGNWDRREHNLETKWWELDFKEGNATRVQQSDWKERRKRKNVKKVVGTGI